MKQINVRITDELHRAIKMKAVDQGKTMTEIVRELLAKWVENGEETQAEGTQEK